jgi:hypothetical protein
MKVNLIHRLARRGLSREKSAPTDVSGYSAPATIWPLRRKMFGKLLKRLKREEERQVSLRTMRLLKLR